MVQERPFARCSESTLRPQTDVSANKMLRSARMAAMTGRTAAFLGGGQWRLRAVHVSRHYGPTVTDAAPCTFLH